MENNMDLGNTKLEEAAQASIQRLLQYNQLLQTDPVAAATFLENNKHDVMFVFTVKNQEALKALILDAAKDHIPELQAALSEDVPNIQQAMLESLVMGPIGDTAVEKAIDSKGAIFKNLKDLISASPDLQNLFDSAKNME
jgi:hypothetical protein